MHSLVLNYDTYTGIIDIVNVIITGLHYRYSYEMNVVITLLSEDAIIIL